MIWNSNDSDMMVTDVVESLLTVQDLSELVDVFLGHLKSFIFRELSLRTKTWQDVSQPVKPLV